MNIEHYPRQRKTQYDNRIGEQKRMKCGLIATITQYYNRHDITVKMSNGTTIYKRTYTDFTQGNINPNKTRQKYKIT